MSAVPRSHPRLRFDFTLSLPSPAFGVFKGRVAGFGWVSASADFGCLSGSRGNSTVTFDGLVFAHTKDKTSSGLSF